MTRYETLCRLGNDFPELVAKKLVPAHLLKWKTCYDSYHKIKKKRKKEVLTHKTSLAALTAAEHNISERSMFSIIAFMESE